MLVLPSVLETIFRLAILAIAFPVHEFAHAWTATRFGDPTPKQAGRLTLNPLVHLDLWGTILFLLTGFGWAKPTPISPYYLRSPRAFFWVSFAGPLSNLLLAITAAILHHLFAPFLSLSSFGRLTLHFLAAMVYFDLLLFFFNLIPIPPLDGDMVIAGLFPRFWQQYLAPLRPYAVPLLLVVLFVLPTIHIDVLGWLVISPTIKIGRLLLG